jgi:multisubunit Na+/H+ antiporter MnhG subunit
MIPAIGVMIAAYTITRMLDMLSREGTKTIVKVVGCLAILVTLVCIADVMNAGSRVSSALPY